MNLIVKIDMEYIFNFVIIFIYFYITIIIPPAFSDLR